MPFFTGSAIHFAQSFPAVALLQGTLALVTVRVLYIFWKDSDDSKAVDFATDRELVRRGNKAAIERDLGSY